MLVWLSAWSKVQTCIWPSWCHCHSLTVSCFSKIQTGFTCLVPAHLGSPGKRAIKRCVRVCVGYPIKWYPFTEVWLHSCNYVLINFNRFTINIRQMRNILGVPVSNVVQRQNITVGRFVTNIVYHGELAFHHFDSRWPPAIRFGLWCAWQNLSPTITRCYYFSGVEQRVRYKIAVLAFKLRSTSTPAHLNRHIQKSQCAWNTRSSATPALFKPFTRTNYAKCAFRCSAQLSAGQCSIVTKLLNLS